MTSKTTHDVSKRSTIDLSGSWQFTTDPDDEGHENRWYAPGTDWPSSTETVSLPQAWQEDERHREYTGTAWYRRTVEIDGSTQKEVHLRFCAVDYETTVWVNGERVGENRGGYLPFSVEITDAAVDGENEIVLAVTDPEDIDELPHGKQGEPWYQRVSGVWQPVSLSYLPETRVTGLRATPSLDDDSVTLDLETTVTGAKATDLTATVTIERDGGRVHEADVSIEADGTARLRIGLDDPDYWTPESPSLYDIRVELRDSGAVLDRYEDYFGMRSFEAHDGQFYLNGEPYYIRGALDQGYYPETLYRPFDEELFEYEIRTAKELGFNMLRKHIKPAHPDFLELADRLGILVWEEPANPTRYTERSKAELRDQLRGMIDRDYNRPSVVIWSIYNEEWGIGGHEDEVSLWDDEEKQAYLAELYEEVGEWDPTRPICDNSGWAHVATDVNDYHRYFVSPDRANAWAEDVEAMTNAPEDNYGETYTDPDDAPLVVSEFGTWGFPDLPAVEEYYDGTPPWFDYEFLDDPIKRPEGVHDRFEETTLPDVFEDWDGLAAAWQHREFLSIKDVIEQMRAEPGVAGYVITEFSDIEWEFNGMLDYRREQKSFHDDFARINRPVLVSVEPARRAVEGGEGLTADVVLANDTNEVVDTELSWSLFDQSGTVSVSVEPASVTEISDAISADVPAVTEVTSDELTIAGEAVPENGERITVVPAPDSTDDPEVTVYADDDELASAFIAAGFDVSQGFDDAVDVAIVTDPSPGVEAFAADGGTVLRLPDRDGHMDDDEFFEYRGLPETESWNLVASLFYTDGKPAEAYTGVCPGWELDGLYPYDVVADIDESHDVHVGYVEGWIANWSAAVTVREHGDGRVGAFTFRMTGEEADNPVGTAMLADLIEELAEEKSR